MSQIISTASPLSRAPTLGAEPAPEHAGDAGFAALLAGLFPPPLLQAIAPGPLTPSFVPGEAAGEDALAEQVIPEEALADRTSADGGDLPSARGDASGAPATGDATPSEAAAARDIPAELPRIGTGSTPPPDGSIPASVGAASTEHRQDAAGAKTANAAAVAEPAATTARSSTTTGVATVPATNAGEAPAAASPIPGFGRLGLARVTWQAELVERREIAFTSSFAAAESVAGSGERPAVPPLAEAGAGGATRPVQQLALAIDRAVKGELRQLTIQLSPRDLGTIEIALELDADRRLTVAILAERPETLDLLRQDARQLERLLGQQGVNLAESGLELGLMSGERRGGGERPPASQLELALPDDAPESAAAGEVLPAPSAGGAHRLNLSI